MRARGFWIQVLLLAGISFLGFLKPLLVQASETEGRITSAAYAWSENLGWINFGCNACRVVITDSRVTGYAWSPTSGWINLQPLFGGVLNTPDGILSGYAWSEQFGWLEFSGITIGDDGVWRGWAGQSDHLTGRINFDCQYCGVATDWRPERVRARPAVASSSGGGGSRRKPSATASSSLVTMGWPVDIIKDGSVDLLDFNRLMVEWGRRGEGLLADLTADTVVDLFDFNRLMVEWGKRYAWAH